MARLIYPPNRLGKEVLLVFIGKKIIPRKDPGIFCRERHANAEQILKGQTLMCVHMCIFLLVKAKLFLRIGT